MRNIQKTPGEYLSDEEVVVDNTENIRNLIKEDSEDEDKNLARDRFKFYRDCGFRLNAIDESELITL